MIKCQLNYLKHIGILEFFLALYPILSGYAYGFFRLDLFVLILMIIIAFNKTNRVFVFKPLIYLAAYVVLHELILFFFLKDMPVYHLNNLLSIIIFFSSIFFIVPAINFNKLVVSLVIVGIISTIGILYHFIILKNGGEVHPIKLPFLPDLMNDSRLYELGNRPSSFYWEPAAFVTFMMVPLFLSLYMRKFVYTIIIILAMFLSTSSTGIILSILMVCVYVLTQKIKAGYRILLIISSLALVFILIESELFESGVSKIENTDIENTSRLINGPTLVSGMPFEHWITGMISSNVNDYYYQTNYLNIILIPTKEGTIFVSTFWLVLAKFGILGLLLYLNFYIKIIKINRLLLPYVMVLIIALFSQGFMFSSIFAFQVIFILSFIRYCESKAYER